MAKPKSFKNELNPALQFISIQDPKNIQSRDNVQGENNILDERTLQNLKKVQDSENLQKNTAIINNKKAAGYKINPQYIETKSKRVQLLMQPSLYEKVKIQADENGLSVNEYIHSLLYQVNEQN